MADLEEEVIAFNSQFLGSGKSPLVSIVMAAYNAESYLDKAIESLITQSYANWELLIRDDGSSDGTLGIMEQWADRDERIRIFQNSQNEGYLATVNLLFQDVRGAYITFLDADDWVTTNRVELQLSAFQEDTSLGICGSNAAYITTEGEKLRESIQHFTDEEIRAHIREHNQFCGAAIMVPKIVLDQVGGYNPLFDRILNEDYDWSRKIVEKYKAINIPEVLYFVRTTRESLTRSIYDPLKWVSIHLVHWLGDRREQGLEEPLSREEPAVQEKLRELLAPYQDDPSLVFRKSADQQAYNQDHAACFGDSKKAWLKRPLKWINWKYLIGTGLRALKN